MKKFTTPLLTVAVLALAMVGCANIKVRSIALNPITGVVATNSFDGTFFFAKSVAERIDVISTTKTTTKLIGAKNVEQSGDVEMVKAISGALGEAFAAGAKTAIKP